MKKIFPVQKVFLKKSAILILVSLSLLILTATAVYNLMLQALQQEVETMNQNTAQEFEARLEDAISQANQLSSKLVTSQNARLFFTHEQPDTLVENLFDTLYQQMKILQNSYISSITLYAPKYGHLLFDTSNQCHMLSELADDSQYDLSWLDDVDETERTTTSFTLRARFDRWPYYLTLIKHYRSGSVDGVAAIDIDLQKLYSYLIANKEESVQLYLIDCQDRVILMENKQALFTPVSEIDTLSEFRPKETFGFHTIGKNSGYSYMQVYSEKYDMTCVTVTQLGEYMVRLSLIRQQFLLVVSLAAVLAMVLAGIYSLHIRRPFREIRSLLSSTEQNTDTSNYAEEIRDIADQIISHIQTNAFLRQELDTRLNLLKDSQMLALQAQINPHFLYNTLNVISMMVESECGDGHIVVQMLSDLSSLLRYSLSESKHVCVAEEVAYVERYLSIVKYRYDNFSISIDVAPETKQYAIPKLVLQPLIENAIQHGLSPALSLRPGTLQLRIHETMYTYPTNRELRSVCIDVSDNGVGISEDKLETLRSCLTQYDMISREHIGLSNVAHRFYLLFHTEHSIKIESVSGQGTTVRIIFPAIDICKPA